MTLTAPSAILTEADSGAVIFGVVAQVKAVAAREVRMPGLLEGFFRLLEN